MIPYEEGQCFADGRIFGNEHIKRGSENLYGHLVKLDDDCEVIDPKALSLIMKKSEKTIRGYIKNLIDHDYMDEAEDPETGKKYFRFFSNTKTDMDLEAQPHKETKKERDDRIKEMHEAHARHVEKYGYE